MYIAIMLFSQTDPAFVLQVYLSLDETFTECLWDCLLIMSHVVPTYLCAVIFTASVISGFCSYHLEI